MSGKINVGVVGLGIGEYHIDNYLKCKDAKAVTMENRRPATQGVCPTYGAKTFRIGKS